MSGPGRLEEAGCRVVYGLDGYKVHSKLCLITTKNRAGQLNIILRSEQEIIMKKQVVFIQTFPI